MTRSWADEPRAVPPDPTGATLHWAEQLCTFFAEPEPDERLLDGLVFTLIERLVGLDRSARTQAEYHPVVSAALDTFVTNLDTRLDMKDVAKRLGSSYVHFGRLFREELGSGPLRYHTELRLDRAKQLLLNPYLRVSQVGAACGFDDLNYFVRRFRQRFGVAPGAWRNEHLRSAASLERTTTDGTDDLPTTDFIDSSAEIALERVGPT